MARLPRTGSKTLLFTASKVVDNRVVRSMFRDPCRSINCNPFLLTPNCPRLTWMSAQGITKQPAAVENLWLGHVCQPKPCPSRAPFNGSRSVCCRGTLEKVLTFLPPCGPSAGKALFLCGLDGDHFLLPSAERRLVLEQLNESPSPERSTEEGSVMTSV